MSVAASFIATVHHWPALFAMLPVACQYAGVVLFGLVIGSFLTVVVHRLPIMLERAWQTEMHTTRSTDRCYNLWLPRSHCPSCQQPLALSENLPVVSYLLLRGRCAACNTVINPRYLVLELMSACFAVIALWRFGVSAQALAAYGLAATLLALAWIDIDTRLLPDPLTLPLLWAGLFVNLDARFASLSDAVIGALSGYLSLWLVSWLFRRIRGIEGIGYGDFKLFAALGAWLGWIALPHIVLLASASGALFGLTAIASGRLKKDQPLPFGPFLAASGLITLFFGTPLYQWMWEFENSF